MHMFLKSDFCSLNIHCVYVYLLQRKDQRCCMMVFALYSLAVLQTPDLELASSVLVYTVTPQYSLLLGLLDTGFFSQLV